MVKKSVASPFSIWGRDWGAWIPAERGPLQILQRERWQIFYQRLAMSVLHMNHFFTASKGQKQRLSLPPFRSLCCSPLCHLVPTLCGYIYAQLWDQDKGATNTGLTCRFLRPIWVWIIKLPKNIWRKKKEIQEWKIDSAFYASLIKDCFRNAWLHHHFIHESNFPSFFLSFFLSFFFEKQYMNQTCLGKLAYTDMHSPAQRSNSVKIHKCSQVCVQLLHAKPSLSS